MLGFLLILFLFPIYQCNDCRGRKNTFDVVPAQPKFVRREGNGTLYVITNGNDSINLLVLKGTAYEQGLAYGKLMGPEIKSNIYGIVDYIKSSMYYFLKIVVPIPVAHFICDWAIRIFYFGLDITWLLTKPYTPQRFYDEMKGISDGANIPYMEFLRISLFPELIKAACSLVGAWGNATFDKNAYFLRAFDWDTNSPMQKSHIIVVYHSTEPNSITYATLGYCGLIGALTVVNEKGLAMGMKHWPSTYEDNVKTQRAGKPFHFVLRDIGQFKYKLVDAIQEMKDITRTVSIHIGIMTAESNTYREIRYSADKVSVYDDKSYPQVDEIHPLIPGVTYVDRNIQPTDNDCLGSLLKSNLGQITPEFFFRELAPLHRSGDCQIFVFDMIRKGMYFAVASYAPKISAHDKPMFYITFDKLFKELTA